MPLSHHVPRCVRKCSNPGRIVPAYAIGIQRSIRSECSAPLNRAGATPTIVSFLPSTVTRVPIAVGDASKLRDATGWAPRRPIDDMLSRLLEYWRERVAADTLS